MVTNLDTNPRKERTDGEVELWRNLATNPNFSRTSGTVEVRRNYVNSYSLNEGSGFYVSTTNAASSIIDNPFGGSPAFRVESLGVGTSTMEKIVSAPKGQRTLTVWLRKSPDAVMNNIGVQERQGSYNWIAGGLFLGDITEEWQEFSFEERSNQDGTRPGIILTLAAVAGSWFEIALPTVSTQGDAFDGGTSPDPDLTPRWLGTPNASESVLEGQRVADVNPVECVAIASTWEGQPAMRLIPTSDNTLSRAEFRLVNLTPGTLLATAHVRDSLTGPFDRRRIGIDWYNPQTDGPTGDNIPGDYELRMSYGGFTSGNTVRLWHGGSQGSGDVWWTDLAIVPGTYTGPYFDGNTELEDSDLWTEWVGEENASASVVKALKVADVAETPTPATVKAYSSTDSPLSGSRLLRYQFSGGRAALMPVSNVTPAVGVGNPMTSIVRVRARDEVSVVLGNYTESSGTEFTILPAGKWVTLRRTSNINYDFPAYGGLAISSPTEDLPPNVIDIDSSLVAEGEYTGPYFDGSMRGYYWAGEPDNSVSIKAPRPKREQRRKMYFGVPGAMSWVPCPQIERPSGLTQWQEEVPLLNGGLHVRRSYGGHRVFEMTWNGISSEEAQLLEGYASGVYGDGLIYWLDPMMADKNVLPIWWSAPAMGALGAPSLGPGGSKPIASPAPVQGLPPQQALFEFRQTMGSRLWVPVPENHRLWVYYRGWQTSTAGLYADPGNNAGLSNLVTPLNIDDPSVPVFHQVPSFTGSEGVSLFLGTSSGGVSTAHIRDIGAQVLPLGYEPEQETPYIAGMGAAGCVVTEFEKTDMSAAFNKVNVTMVLSEVGPWR